MIAQIFVSSQTDQLLTQFTQILLDNHLKLEHPDVLYFEEGSKFGVTQAKQVRQFLSIKPYSAQGKAIVIISGEVITPDAQNALLKSLEEPPEEAIILIGTNNEENLLVTIRSRCQIVRVGESDDSKVSQNDESILKLLSLSIEDRFLFIEKTDKKEQLLLDLIHFFRQRLLQEPHLVKDLKLLAQAEQWQKANVGIRPILEYLMLELPK